MIGPGPDGEAADAIVHVVYSRVDGAIVLTWTAVPRRAARLQPLRDDVLEEARQLSGLPGDDLDLLTVPASDLARGVPAMVDLDERRLVLAAPVPMRLPLTTGVLRDWPDR